MVYFIGAGPGDPELITVKGARLLSEVEVVIYTGSLVNPKILDYCREGAEIYNSAGMTLEEVLAVIQKAHAGGKKVARVHTGDPALYGAIQEQMDALSKEGIPFMVVPGVSSFFAAAAGELRADAGGDRGTLRLLARRGDRSWLNSIRPRWPTSSTTWRNSWTLPPSACGSS
ncbi:MAG: cobalt-precorrin-4/precorrin-4 C(11)-methyltransferase [Peptococcaceae bacterium]|nr:cobalt-precorrin-4/precorrin-4 C(11)-methyltransferase [Peptococcaceae bacterium]